MSTITKYIIASTLLVFVTAKPASAIQASLAFEPSSFTTNVGSEFTTSIIVDTSGYSTGGVGAIIMFDPEKLTATSITTSPIFADYPITSINNEDGIVKISGIVASAEKLYRGSDTFATISFIANTVGNTTISFDYEPGSTTDSNIAVTFGTGDILTKVNSVSVRINPSGSSSIASPDPFKFIKDLSIPNIKEGLYKLASNIKIPIVQNKFASTRDGRYASKKLDPLSPITLQPPITDPYQSQPESEVNDINFLGIKRISPLTYFFIVFGILILTTFYILYRKYKQSEIVYRR